MTGLGMSWSEAEDELLRKAWLEGQSASQIAAQMRGRSRNSVIGRAHRLNIAGGRPKPAPKPRAKGNLPVISGKRAKSFGSMGGRKSAALRAEMPVRREQIRCEEVTPLMVTLEDLRFDQCKWPYGDPLMEGFGFCGHAKGLAGPYCAHHAAKAVTDYVPGMLRGVVR